MSDKPELDDASKAELDQVTDCLAFMAARLVPGNNVARVFVMMVAASPSIRKLDQDERNKLLESFTASVNALPFERAPEPETPAT